MFYYLYKITNLVNNKIYVGVHKTEDINDGYMGSGKVIRSAIEKYGIENFKKDILETFQDDKSMYAREKEIVTEEFLSREDVYNLRRGGYGGWEYINKKGKNLYGKNGQKGYGGDNLLDGSKIKQKMIIENRWDEHKRNLSKLMRKRCEKKDYINPFSGKKHNKKTKKIISLKNKINQSGSKNSQYGTMWITNGIENKKILKESIIPEGWNKGRTCCVINS